MESCTVYGSQVFWGCGILKQRTFSDFPWRFLCLAGKTKHRPKPCQSAYLGLLVDHVSSLLARIYGHFKDGAGWTVVGKSCGGTQVWPRQDLRTSAIEMCTSYQLHSLYSSLRLMFKCFWMEIYSDSGHKQYLSTTNGWQATSLFTLSKRMFLDKEMCNSGAVHV